MPSDDAMMGGTSQLPYHSRDFCPDLYGKGHKRNDNCFRDTATNRFQRLSVRESDNVGTRENAEQDLAGK
jgi:hypothetical protein